jgi:hypothetical protein
LLHESAPWSGLCGEQKCIMTCRSIAKQQLCKQATVQQPLLGNIFVDLLFHQVSEKMQARVVLRSCTESRQATPATTGAAERWAALPRQEIQRSGMPVQVPSSFKIARKSRLCIATDHYRA